MFVCEECHPPACGGIDWHPVSRGACEGCGKGAACYDCHHRGGAPATVPVAETASAALRRLHEDIARTIMSTREAQARVDAERTAVSLIPEIAALVEAVEQDHDGQAHSGPAGAGCDVHRTCVALAALRAKLGVGQ